MNLVLVGVRGSGKSTVGAHLARRLGLSFIDLDHEIESRSGQAVSEIFGGEGGEPTFRRLESETLQALAEIEDTVLATGGGVVLSLANRRLLGELGTVVWLQVSPAEAIRRTAGAPRPALTELSPQAEAEAVAEQREPLYAELAVRAVETDGRSLQEVCDELEQLWHDLSGHNLR